jgi:hypothetical protein
MITAQLFTPEHEAMSGPMSITSKADMQRVVALAQSKEQLTCIRWHNDENGQSGFWGLNGAQVDKYWYGGEKAKRTRKCGAYKDPAKIRKGTSVFLPPDVLTKLHNTPGKNSRIVEDALRFYWANCPKFKEV